MQDIVLHLSDSVMRRAQLAAETLHQPVDQVLEKLLNAVLPDVGDAPPHIQDELARMTWYDDQRLWEIARSGMSEEQEARLRALAALQAERNLESQELEMLNTLRDRYGYYTLRKARAYALLSLRGGRPLLAEN